MNKAEFKPKMLLRGRNSGWARLLAVVVLLTAVLFGLEYLGGEQPMRQMEIAVSMPLDKNENGSKN